MIPSKDDPLRTPDWRWRRAQWLRQHGKYIHKKIDDNETFLIKRYQTEKAKCVNDMAIERLRRRMPGIFYAEQFHDREDIDIRWEMEARFLAHEPFEQIAQKVGMDVAIVYWYERAFYNVTEKLDNRSYITHVAMGRSIHRGLFERDYDLLWKMLGYACGPHMVDSVTSKLTNLQHAVGPDQIDATKHTLTNSAITDKALTAMMTIPVSYNQGLIMEVYHQMVDLQKNAGGGGDVHNLLINNVNAALTSLPFSTERPAVNMPQLTYYDEQSAELRSDEMLAVGLGFDSSAIHDAVKVTFPGAKDGDNAANK